MHTHSILCVTILISGSFLGCSDSDADVIPTGQFDDGTYEIFGPSQESLGLIFAHKGIAVADYSSSYEIWAVTNSYCSSDNVDANMKPCAYQALTFKYVGEKSYRQWTSDVNAKKYDNPRYYRATYQARSAGRGLACAMAPCTFDSATGWSSRVSMFPANNVFSSSASSLPTVVVQQTNDPKGPTTETWYMKAFFTNDSGSAGFVGEKGFTFSTASTMNTSTAQVDCAACTAAIQVDVKYIPCTTQPTDESATGCVEKKQ